MYPDIGYTPDNLKFFLSFRRISRRKAANILGVSVRTVDKWCLPLNSKDHRDMPLIKWQELIKN